MSPDGKRVAFALGHADLKTNQWLYQIHVANLGENSSVQLTHDQVSSTSPEWSPDGKWIAFISRKGSSNANLWLMRSDGSGVDQLTTQLIGGDVLPGARWAPCELRVVDKSCDVDKMRIAFLVQDALTEEEQKKHPVVVDQSRLKTSIYTLNLAKEPGKRKIAKLVEQNTASNSGRMNLDIVHFDWSPNGQEIAYSYQEKRGTEHWTTQHIRIVDVASGAHRRLTSDIKGAQAQPRYSPSGDNIAFMASDYPTTWAFTRRAYVISAKGDNLRRLANTYDRQGSLVGWSGDESQVYVAETREFTHGLLALPVDGRKPLDIDLKNGTLMTNSRMNLTGTHIAFIAESLKKAAEIYTAELPTSINSTADLKPVKVTNEQANLPRGKLGITETHDWKSDGKKIHGLVTYPRGYDTQKGPPLPLVVLLHGGPTEVFTQSFTGVIHVPWSPQIFAGRGYAVLRPNVRGSSGYGHAFRYANIGDWGGGDVRDVIAGVDHLVRKGRADPRRMAVAGVSYGGYLTAATITRTSRFKGAAVVAGITDLVSYTLTTDVPSFTSGYLDSEFWEASRLWRDRSPVWRVRRVKTPTLILQGQGDGRVPPTQSLEFYRALERAGRTTQLVTYPGEAHGIVAQPKFMCDALNRTLAWFDVHVRNIQDAPAEKCTE